MALEFTDGLNTAVNCGDDSSLRSIDPITLSLWIYPVSWGQSSYGRIIIKGNTTIFFLSDGGGTDVETLRFIRYRATTNTQYIGAENAISLNEWQHIAVTSDLSGTIFYVNGVAISNVSAIVGSGALDSDVGSDFLIGNRADLSREFDGMMADVRVYESILSPEAIQTIYASRGRDGIVADLISRWPLSEGAPGTGLDPDTMYLGDDNDVVEYVSSITLTPQSASDGDLLIAVIAACGNDTGVAANMTTPSGWTLVETVDVPDPADVSRPSLWFYRRTASSESGSYTWICNQTSDLIGVLSTYDGTKVDVVEDESGTSTGTSASPIAPSVTLSDDSLVFRAIVGNWIMLPIPHSDTFPSESVGRFESEVENTYNGGVCTALAEQLRPSGASGTATFALYSTTEWAAITVAFNGGPGTFEDIKLKDLMIARNDGSGVGPVVFRASQTGLRRRV